MATTAAAMIAEPDRTFALGEIVLGNPAPGEVLVEMKASGLCHTDLDLLNLGFAHVMGHEGAGTVAACGADVSRVVPGDRVVLNWALPCGNCFQCRRRLFSLCEDRARVAPEQRLHRGAPIPPSFGIATMATHTLVPQSALVRIDVDISFASAAILGCGVMTGVGSVTNVAQVQAGELVVVLGVGGVGLSVVQGARLAGAGAIVAIDLNPERLQMAQRFGAHHLLQADPGDEGLLQAARRVRELLGRGADFAFECTAVPALAAAPLAMVCNGGMAVAVSGFEEVVPVDLRLFEFDKTYINPLYGRCNPEVDFPRLLTLYHAGELLLDEMVTRTYPLTDDGLRAAIDDLQQARNAKGVLLPAQPA